MVFGVLIDCWVVTWVCPLLGLVWLAFWFMWFNGAFWYFDVGVCVCDSLGYCCGGLTCWLCLQWCDVEFVVVWGVVWFVVGLGFRWLFVLGGFLWVWVGG